MKSPTSTTTEVGRRPHLLLTEEDVRRGLDILLGGPEFVIDIETSSLDHLTNELYWIGLHQAGRHFLIPTHHPKGWTLSREHKEKTPACILFPPPDPRGLTPTGKPSMRAVAHTIPAVFSEPPSQLWPNEACELVKPLLFSDRAKIGHNLKFDLMSLAKYFGGELPPGPYIDTLILQHVVDENRKQYDLKTLSTDWFAPRKEIQKLWYPRLGALVAQLGLDDVARYLAKDLQYCWLLKTRMWQHIVRHDLEAAFKLEMDLYPAIMGMEMVGFPVDQSGMGEVKVELDEAIAAIEQEAHSIAGDTFSLSSLDHKRWVMWGWRQEGKPIPTGDAGRELQTQSLKPLSYTKKTGVPQLNQAALAFYEARGDPLASLLLQWSAYDKLRGTFVVGLSSLLRPHNGRLPTLHTNFKQHGTATGRLSAEKPNLQQLPRGSKIRKLFVGDDGHILIVADYDQIELRCLAKEAKEPTMILIFKQGRDIHSEATVTAMQIPMEMVTDSLRQVGKTLNFATGYGAGPERIARVAGVTKREGQKFLDRYYEEFSALEPWKRKMLRAARNRADHANAARYPARVIIPPYGRLRRLPELTNFYSNEEWVRYRAERQAINALIQGFAAYIMKMAMIEMHERLTALDYPATMVCQVHDEIVVRTIDRYADEVMEVVVSSMSDVRNLDGLPILGEIPLLVSAKAGYSWADAKGK